MVFIDKIAGRPLRPLYHGYLHIRAKNDDVLFHCLRLLSSAQILFLQCRQFVRQAFVKIPIAQSEYLLQNRDNTIMSAQVAPVGYTAGTSFVWNTQGQVIAAATILPALGIIGVALRIWSRFHKQTGFGLDDVFILPALVSLSFAGQLFGTCRQR